jgi:hypothetical protein
LQSPFPSIPGKWNGAFNKLLAAKGAVISPMIVELVNVPAMLLEFMKPCFLFGSHLGPKPFFKGVLLGAVDGNRNPEKIMEKHRTKEEEEQIPEELQYPDDIDPEPDHRHSNRP